MLDLSVAHEEDAIRTLLPSKCRWSFHWGAHVAYPLHPREADAVARAVPKRRREFSTGRRCARHALTLCGAPPTAIPMSPDRAPVWPDGFCGSITHCDGFCAAVVAPSSGIRSVGIDAELRSAVSLELADRILTPKEWDQQPIALANDPIGWATTFFAIKEASFKAYFPLGGRILDFDAAEVVLEDDGRSGQVFINDGADRYTFQCRFMSDDARVYAGAHSAESSQARAECI